MDILKMSFAASILIVFTAVIRLLFKKMISKNTVMLLWGIVCCKLMIPVSVFHLTGSALIGKKAAAYQTAGWFDLPAGFYQAVETRKNFNTPAFYIIWAIGMAVMAFYFIWNYLRCSRMFKMSLPVEESWSATHLFEKGCQYRKVKIRISDRIISPLTYGVFQPVILLPKKMDWVNIEHISYVLKHEMAHIKRFDALWKICLSAVLVCHWFNPLVWVMYFYANRDIELACDENVIRTLSRKQCTAYAIMLVEWSKEKSDGNPMVSYLMHNFMEERIINIMKKRKLGILGIMLSVVLAAGAVTVYAATPATTQTAGVNQLSGDLTLGGIFELYTPEEYQQIIDNIKKYSSAASSQDIKAMEEDLARLKADNGKGEFVIYKPSFNVYKEVNGSSTAVGFNPTIVMAPQFVRRDIPLTAETYQKDIEEVTSIVDQAVLDGFLTSAQRTTILNKMNENMAELR